MKKYALDTNVYINAFRRIEAADELKSFYAAFAPSTYLSSVVLHELLVGTTSASKARDVDQQIAGPFRRTRRVLTPSAEAWALAGESIAAMARRDKRDLRTLPKSLVNDFLLAASCRESGVILITHNLADFASINRFIKVQFTETWPK